MGVGEGRADVYLYLELDCVLSLVYIALSSP